MFALFALACGIGVPIGFAMIASGLVYLMVTGGDLGLVAAQGVNGLFSSFILLAVPLFIFAAEVMTVSNISDRLLRFVLLTVGRLRGGLAYVNIAVSIIFAGMSGSALADAAGPGKLMTDMMTRDGRYPRGFAGALTPGLLSALLSGLVSVTAEAAYFRAEAVAEFRLRRSSDFRPLAASFRPVSSAACSIERWNSRAMARALPM